MSDFSKIMIVFLLFVMPLWIIFHYLLKFFLRVQSNKGLSMQDEKTLEDLWKIADHMEQRMRTLEVILKDDFKTGEEKSR